MARQQSPGRRVCPATSHPTAPHGLLLLHLDARNRSCCPALHDRAALGNRSSNHNRNVTHVPGQSVTDVMRLDSLWRRVGRTNSIPHSPPAKNSLRGDTFNAARNDRTPEGPRGLNARANPSGEATDFIAFALAFI